MMVALAIFSLAALAILRLEGATLKSTATLADRAVGEIVVRNLAVQILTDPLPSAFGKGEGAVVNAGRTWRWTRDVKRTADARIVRIDLNVIDDGGRSAGTLVIARPAT